ncbi:MAG: hypothetical protein O3B64_03505 [bacterium]|nr:hypothetical protein [bacterium]
MKIFTWKQRAIVFLVTIATIALFALIGYLIGRAAGSGTIGLVIAVLLSYPATQFQLAKTMRRLYDTNKH